MYDIRSQQPTYTKEHQYGLPVIDVSFHKESGNVISTDKKLVKIWKQSGGDAGRIMTNIEPGCDINAVLPVTDTRGPTGMIFVAGEQAKIMTYFEKSLDSGSGTTYEDYKFLTKTEVEDLGASGLIGTPMLRAYMHGFFIEMSLYSKLRAVSKPFEYEEHRKARIREKVEERRKSRITALKRLPSVNKQLAEKILRKKGAEEEGGGEAAALVDDRFAALFKREEFEQDKESFEYRLRNPTLSSKESGKGKGGRHEEEDEDDLHEVDEDDDEDFSDGDGDSDSGNSVGNEVRYMSDSPDDDAEESMKRSKVKGRGGAGRAGKKGVEDDDDEGAIGRATRRILAKREMKEMKSESSSGSKRRKQLSRADRGGGAQMFELADGVAGERAVFAHTAPEKERRREEKRLGRQLLADRLQSVGGDG
ncbi:nol10, partial [Symbiodinium microadriaticum]